MSDRALYTTSNALNNGLEVIKAVNTGRYDKVVANGKTQLDHYLTGSAMNAGVNSYVIGYAKNILNGMSLYGNGNIALRFAQATGLADLFGGNNSQQSVPVGYPEALYNPQNYYDHNSGSNSSSITNSSIGSSSGHNSSTSTGGQINADVFQAMSGSQSDSHVYALNKTARSDAINSAVYGLDKSALDGYVGPTLAKYSLPPHTFNAGFRYTPAANDSTGKRSLVEFLLHVNSYGILVLNNFEVEFDGVDGLTLFVNSFELPGSKLNTCEIFYDGIKITIPVNYEHEHEFSMTILNDMQGYIYSTIKSFIELDSYNHYTRPTNTMRVKSFSGQVSTAFTGLEGDNGNSVPYQGAMIICYGVRLTSISGLTYGQSNNDILTFTVQGTLIEYSHLPLGLSKQVSHSSI